jgi:hypothetical protein
MRCIECEHMELHVMRHTMFSAMADATDMYA